MLTDRERETAILIGRGWTTREIATEHFMSVKTTEYQLRNI